MVAPRLSPRAAALVVVVLSVIAAGQAAMASPSAAPGGYQVSRFTVAGNPTAVAVDTADGYLYVASAAANAVSVVNAATGATVKTISLSPYYPGAITVDPVTDTVYVTGYDNHQLPVLGAVFGIDGATGDVVRSVSGSNLGFPTAIAVDSATSTLYLLNRFANDIQVMNAATLSLNGTTIKPPSGGFANVAVDQATDKIYVSGAALVGGVRSGVLWTVDGTTHAVIGPVDLGVTSGSANGVAFDAANGTVYVALGQSVLSVDPASGTITHSYPVVASSVAVDPADGLAYASTPTGWVSVLDMSSQSVVAAFPRGGWGVAADPVSGEAYIAGGGYGVWTITPAASTTMSPAISNVPQPAEFEIGTAAAFPLRVTATPAPTCSVTGTLPPGVAVSPGCVIEGKPAAGSTGDYTVAVTAGNGVNPPYTVTAFIRVFPSLAITSLATATFTAGVAAYFAASTTPTSYPGPTFSETGPLPAGVTSTSTGTLSGTPSAKTGGIYHITLKATLGTGPTATVASQAFTLTVNQQPAFSSPDQVSFTHGKHGTITIRTSGFPVAHLTEQGKLPRGLSFHAGPGGTATISGTPAGWAKGQKLVLTIIARSSAGLSAQQKLTITVR